MSKFCMMLSYFSIFVLIVSAIVCEENSTFSFENETVIDNENQTLKVKDHKISKDDVLVDLTPKISPVANQTLHLKSNGNNENQKNSVSSKFAEVQLDENGKTHNWKDFQNGTFTTTIVSKANKTVKIKIRKVKLDRSLEDHKENSSINHNTTSNYTDQEPSESSFRIEIGSIPHNKQFLEIENDNNWNGISSDTFGDINRTSPIMIENLSQDVNFEVNRNVQQNSSTQNIIPSQPEILLENPGTFSIIVNSTQNFNDWRGMDTFTQASEFEDEKVDLFQNFSQSFNDEGNFTIPTVATLLSNGTSYLTNHTPEFLEELEKSYQNQTNFQFDTTNFDNSTDRQGTHFGTNQTVNIDEQNLNYQNSSNSDIQEYSNETSDGYDKNYEMLGMLNQFKIHYLNENRKLLQNLNNNRNFNQIQFDDGNDWKAIVGVVPIFTNNNSTIADQTINFPSNSNIRFIDSASNSQNTQPSLNTTENLGSKSRYSDYQPSGSADNFQLQPLEENFEDINQDTFTNVDHQEPNYDEVQISKPSINHHEEFENLNFENQATEKFIPNSNWNLEEEWKAISGKPKLHIGTETEIKIENHVPFPYPIVKNVLYPVEKQVPFPIKVEVPSPYPVIKEIRVPKKVSVTVPVPIYTPVPVEKVVKYPVRVPVDQPYPVQVKVPHYYPVEVQIPFPVKVKVPKPVPIIKKVPYEVKHIYHVPKPYPVHKNVYYPVKVHFERLVRYNVYKPFPHKVYKNVYFPYYIEKPYPVNVYEDKGVRAPVEQKPSFFNHGSHPIDNHQPVRYEKHPEAIPVFEDNHEKPPSEFQSNSWKVNYDPYGEIQV